MQFRNFPTRGIPDSNFQYERCSRNRICLAFCLPFSGKVKCCIAVTRTPKVSISFSSALKLKDSCNKSKEIFERKALKCFWLLSAFFGFIFGWCVWVRKSYLEGGIVTLLDNFRFLTLHLLKDKSVDALFMKERLDCLFKNSVRVFVLCLAYLTIKKFV